MFAAMVRRSWLLLLLACCAPNAFASAPSAWLLRIDGAIGPASADYVTRNLTAAAGQGAALVIVQMDTPGGLETSMRGIVQTILGSAVPVACLVAPSGARAASAGTYILYACHIAAMANATHLGAATPVAIGGARPSRPADNGQDSGDAMEQKRINDATAYIRALAQLRGRNADWAERAVRGAATLTAREALDAGVIDVIAQSPEQLLQAIDGRRVALRNQGEVLQLHTANLHIRVIAQDWRSRFLSSFTDPNIAYVLMLIGVYGLLLEFLNPGSTFPGVAGGICLLLALYAFQLLPISYTGLALLALGMGLMVAEAMLASFGVLGIGGVIAFVIGSILLLDTQAPGFRIALPLILLFAVISCAFLIFVIGMALKARHGRAVSGAESWIGSVGEALEDFPCEGMVRVRGELWRGRCVKPVRRGQRLIVIGIDGLVLQVSPLDEEEPSS